MLTHDHALEDAYILWNNTTKINQNQRIPGLKIPAWMRMLAVLIPFLELSSSPEKTAIYEALNWGKKLWITSKQVFIIEVKCKITKKN